MNTIKKSTMMNWLCIDSNSYSYLYFFKYCIKRKIMKQLTKKYNYKNLEFWADSVLPWWKRTFRFTIYSTVLFNLVINKKYIICFKLVFCTTLKSNRGENLNTVYICMYVDFINRLGTFSKISYSGSGRQTFSFKRKYCFIKSKTLEHFICIVNKKKHLKANLKKN